MINPAAPQIEPAKPVARRVAVLAVVLSLVAGFPLLYVTRRYLSELTVLAERDPEAALEGFRTWVLPQVLLMAAAGLAAGGWLAAVGLRARRTRRFPQPGAWVLQDTPVREGTDAERVGLVLIVVGVVIAAVPVLLLAILTALVLR